MWLLCRYKKRVTIRLIKLITLHGGRRTKSVAYSHEFRRGNNTFAKKSDCRTQSCRVGHWSSLDPLIIITG